MLVERPRELVRAVAARDEIQEPARLRLHRGLQRRGPRHRDRGRRQSVARVGVPRRVGGQILLADVAIERLAHAIDHGGIGLQAHAGLQAIQENRGHQRPLGRDGGFLLDDGGEDERLIRRFEA